MNIDRRTVFIGYAALTVLLAILMMASVIEEVAGGIIILILLGIYGVLTEWYLPSAEPMTTKPIAIDPVTPPTGTNPVTIDTTPTPKPDRSTP